MPMQIGEPSSQRAILAMPDGTVRVISPAAPIPDGQPEAQFMAFVAQHAIASAGLSGEIWAMSAQHVATVDRTEIEQHKRFRGFMVRSKSPLPYAAPADVPSALRWDGSALTIDLATARAQVLAETRFERNRRLFDSDAIKAKLTETGTVEQKAAFAVYRQQLRDLPATVTGEIAVLDALALATYTPAFPTSIEAPNG